MARRVPKRGSSVFKRAERRGLFNRSGKWAIGNVLTVPNVDQPFRSGGVERARRTRGARSEHVRFPPRTLHRVQQRYQREFH